MILFHLCEVSKRHRSVSVKLVISDSLGGVEGRDDLELIKDFYSGV